MKKLKVLVFVLGDSGRSPRMQFHTWSLSNLEIVDQVILIGYSGEKLMKDINSNKVIDYRIDINVISYWLQYLPKFYLIQIFFKSIILMVYIMLILWSFTPFDVLLIQNPPATPIFAAVLFLKTITFGLFNIQGSNKIILDWHNLGYSMFPSWRQPTEVSKDGMLVIPKQSLFIRLARMIEIYLARLLVHQHICVSNSMQSFLQSHHQFKNVKVLHDKPFKKTCNSSSLENKHQLLEKYKLTWEELKFPNIQYEGTIHTYYANKTNKIELHRDPPFVIVSSTSWTPDEDFDMLLESILQVDKALRETTSQTCLVIITGKGPMKSCFEEKVYQLDCSNQLHRVRIRCLWLSSIDYPLFLSLCDIGLSLHTSTSGLDLPMKILDMFGCGLPVLAFDFFALSELVCNNETGLIFNDIHNLRDQILHVIKDQKLLKSLRRNVSDMEIALWNDNWNRVMPMILNEIN